MNCASGLTSTPWAASKKNGVIHVKGRNKSWLVCWVVGYGKNIRHPSDEAEAAANAAFIVTACNSHDAICDALKEAQRFLDHFAEGCTSFVGRGTPKSCLAQIRAALILAGD